MLLPELSPVELRGRGMTSQRTRDRMVERLVQQGIRDTRVLDVMASEPRHLFVDEALAHHAYEDTALPIGFGQTLSQPLTVARMTELVLRSQPRHVLEVGTGSGYQTLILSRLVASLYSIERIYALHERAAERLWRLDAAATLTVADGGDGWPEVAPFDVILLTACAQTLPEALLEQLSRDGVLIAPLEEPDGSQWLTQIKRVGGAFEKRRLEPVRFVPLLQGVVD
ncbi:MAG: protein-L-isoaspartate(D-aspartate) O-methyltransferase [Halomonas sp.]|uniref:protein-L-isoaspartate(D-aspartate) O-methyltransferase n=1 Tax=unclassified Halomonas TaxID=2609666 RepID=UPI000990733F|nr:MULTISPECIES: protein-L-isoaspartate(D-aspartate) O-methyltransferase [unclassified Halomonas]AQU83321.1 protein-L-isoaspartate O-methyltransferase [Halomonas sp. 'Soap Lake \